MKLFARFNCAFGAIVMGMSAQAWAGQGKPCLYQDLMPAYAEFASQTAELPPQERAVAFVAKIARRFPDYYAPKAFGDEAKLQARAVRFFDPALRAATFPGMQPLTDERLEQMGRVIGAQFVEQQRRFMQTFADFRCQSTVEFGVSLLQFDGHPVDFGGREHLLFGVDVIAMLHVPADMPAFFDHEIFHLYQSQVVGARAPKGDEPAWWMMWREGLATYVSQRMNPALTPQQVLWYPADMVARIEPQRARAAALILRDIDSTGNEADRWFLASASVDGLPARAGYYLGYLFAQHEAGARTLSQLARLRPAQVHRDARDFLSQLAQAAPPP